MKNKVILLAGPTAGGKSALALALAERLDGAIVNADSMQVYEGLRVMTARPAPEDEARAPHYLYGYRPADAPSSAADWAGAATDVLDRLWAEGRLPIVVGGTGLYFRTLVDGISPIPDIPPAVRAAIRARMDQDGPEALHDALAAVDPATAARLAPRDSQRIARALEVMEATGRALAEWQTVPPTGGLRDRADVTITSLVLAPPRDLLYARCNARLEEMVTSGGGLDEVWALGARALDPSLPVMKSLGVPEFLRHLRGELSYDAALTLAQTATRHYAKRQLTWFRNQFTTWPSGDVKFLKSFLSENDIL